MAGMGGTRRAWWLALALIAAATPALAEPPSAVILMYHRFGEDDIPSTNIRLAQFERHLAILASPAYHVLPLPEVVAALAAGRPLPDRTVAITVDDAYASVYREAWPRLRAAGFPFTLFVATDAVGGGRRMMRWDQIRELAAAGVTIGNHSASHAHMAYRDAATNRADIARATARLTAELGATPKLFAYPYGEYSTALREVVAASGFTAAFGQHSGVAFAGGDRYALPRFALNQHFGTAKRFRLVVDALPLTVSEVTPSDPLLGRNPPPFGFTVAAGVGDLGKLDCYPSNGAAARIQRLGARRVEVRITAPFPPGRSRVNCTMPATDGRWRWFGMQFLVPPPS